jgi:hypothetical protein
MIFAKKCLYGFMMILLGSLGSVKQANAIPLTVATTELATLSLCIQRTLTFASEETIVVGCYPGKNDILSAVIATFRWREGNLDLSATRELALDRPAISGEPYAVALRNRDLETNMTMGC